MLEFRHDVPIDAVNVMRASHIDRLLPRAVGFPLLVEEAEAVQHHLRDREISPLLHRLQYCNEFSFRHAVRVEFRKLALLIEKVDDRHFQDALMHPRLVDGKV